MVALYNLPKVLKQQC